MIRTRVLIDTGPLVGLLSKRDQYSDICRRVASGLPMPVYTCWPVVAEAAYLLRNEVARRNLFLSKCDGSRFQILTLDADDIPSIVGILKRYADQKYDLADACLMHLAEREGIDHVFTLDVRHFSTFRTQSGKALNLLWDS